MKTKPFLLATAGSTVDGREIDAKMLEEMASSYDPATYCARLNIEHIRGLSGEGPFRAYGDIVSLSTGEVDVNFNGKTEKRTALYGVLDVTDDAKKLTDAGQKLYPSIEIEPNFAGKGFAYCMGTALTDSPASIATERLKFNRHMPGTIRLSRDTAAALECEDDDGITDGGSAFLGSFKAMLDGFAAKFGAPRTDPVAPSPSPAPIPAPAPVAPADAFAQLRPVIEDMGTAFVTAINDLRTEFRAEQDRIAVKIHAIEQHREDTPSDAYRRRPVADGGAGNYSGIF